MKFEVHTTVITKVEKEENEAMATARKLSLRYGRATVWAGYNKLATYVKGVKRFWKNFQNLLKTPWQIPQGMV